MTRPVSQVKLSNGLVTVDVSAWVDRAGYQPPAANLRGAIAQASVRLVNPTGDLDGVIPVQPREGLELLLYDPTAALVFGGYVADPLWDIPGPGTPAWELTAQSWAARMAECSTGSLNKSGVVDTDANFIIAMFRDALGGAAQRFGSDTSGIEDPIITANEAVSWSGIRGVTFLYGTDWSYRTLLDVAQDLLSRVPGASLRIRPDKIVEYGIFADPAPFVLAGFPSAALMGATAPRSYTAEVLADSPVAYWRLGEAVGSALALDSSGNARHATYAGPTLGQVGAVHDDDRAASFDGIDDVATTASFDYAMADPNVLTIEAWVRTSVAHSGPNRDTIYGANDTASQPQLELGGSAGADRVAVIIPGIFVAETGDGAVPADGLNHYIVYVRRGLGLTNEIWVDGTQRSLVTHNASTFVNGASVKRLGSRAAASQFLDGVPDEIAVYATAFSATRIAEHYEAGRRARVAEIVAGTYREEVLAAGHFNQVRLGGAGAAEEIAYDQVSHGTFGRTMSAPYENIEEIPAGDLRRAAYAKLATFAPRRVASCATYRDDLEPGMLVAVLADELGCIGDEGWRPDGEWSINLGTPTQEPADGWRGELLVQKVTPTFVGPDTQVYALELGAYIPDLDRALAERIGTSG